MSRKRQRGVKGASPKKAAYADRAHPSLPLSGHLSLKGRDFGLQRRARLEGQKMAATLEQQISGATD
ncbi:hypothetical protein AZF01_06240 [Martelella sp. AD-3]|nr:hypothetical protein AZF01_06240 [Martelella sp. AD-3]